MASGQAEQRRRRAPRRRTPPRPAELADAERRRVERRVDARRAGRRGPRSRRAAGRARADLARQRADHLAERRHRQHAPARSRRAQRRQARTAAAARRAAGGEPAQLGQHEGRADHEQRRAESSDAASLGIEDPLLLGELHDAARPQPAGDDQPMPTTTRSWPTASGRRPAVADRHARRAPCRAGRCSTKRRANRAPACLARGVLAALRVLDAVVDRGPRAADRGRCRRPRGRRAASRTRRRRSGRPAGP